MILVFGIKIGDKYVTQIDYKQGKTCDPGWGNKIQTDPTKIVIEYSEEFFGWSTFTISNMVKNLSEAIKTKSIDLQEIKLIPKYE